MSLRLDGTMRPRRASNRIAHNLRAAPNRVVVVVGHIKVAVVPASPGLPFGRSTFVREDPRHLAGRVMR